MEQEDGGVLAPALQQAPLACRTVAPLLLSSLLPERPRELLGLQETLLLACVLGWLVYALGLLGHGGLMIIA